MVDNMTDWKFKYKPHAICIVENGNGEIVQVRIEGVVCSRHSEWQPIYHVREVVSGWAYSVAESNLRAVAVSR
jgi:hypothetical protein